MPIIPPNIGQISPMPIGAQIKTVIFPFAASKSVTATRIRSVKPEKKQMGRTGKAFFRAVIHPHNKKDIAVMTNIKTVCTDLVGADSF